MRLAVAVLALVVTAGARAQAPSCEVSGTVSLVAGGRALDAEARVVVYVERVDSAAWRPQPRLWSIYQREKAFVPSVLVVVRGDSVEFTNDDKIAHSVFSNSETSTFDFPQTKKGITGTRTFQWPGPVRIQCDIHSAMRADVLVVSNPYFAVAKAKGTWRIAGLPPGDYTVVAWEPNGGTTRQVVKACAESTPPVELRVEQAPEPVRRQKNGSLYREYQ